jgi:hypothetical protein
MMDLAVVHQRGDQTAARPCCYFLLLATLLIADTPRPAGTTRAFRARVSVYQISLRGVHTSICSTLLGADLVINLVFMYHVRTRKADSPGETSRLPISAYRNVSSVAPRLVTLPTMYANLVELRIRVRTCSLNTSLGAYSQCCFKKR